MSHTRELALADFRQFFPQQVFLLPKKIKTPAFKALIVVFALLFSLVSLPWQGSAEGILTPDNLLFLVNQDRTQRGLSPLRSSLKLARAAEDKARDMLQNNYFAHTSPSGLEPWDFIKAQTFAYLSAGENLAINYTNPYELENDFINSDPHRENLLSPLFTEIGIAVVAGTYKGQGAVFTVQMFASPVQ
ncbi:MAG: hypothetical protein HY396_02705 [Candidatus Doudnabacteria bacterium]|nr:hypothetical protein [Candidatus Doudnabacteria bacterium]